MKNTLNKFLSNVENRKDLYINLFTVLLFLLLPYLFFKDTSTIGTYFYGQGDALFQNLPIRFQVAESLRNLEFPLWNPLSFSGMPLFADIQSGVLYFLNTAIALLSPSILLAFNLSTLLHYSLAGIFTFLLTRQYKISAPAAFIAGLIFMFSGFMVIRKSHSQMLYTAVWLPLIILFVQKYKDSRRFKFILFGALTVALQFFAGATQIFLYSSIVVLFYIAFIFVMPRGSEGPGQRLYVLNCLWMFVLFVPLAMVQLSQAYGLLNFSVRQDIDFAAFSLFSFDPRSIPQLFMPYVYGKINPAQYSSVSMMFAGNGIEQTIFIGFLPFFLALAGFFNRNRYKFFWAFIGLFSLVMVLGSYTPVYRLAYNIPLINNFRIPTRHWFEFSLAVAVLAGFGFDWIYKGMRENRFLKNMLIVTATIISLGTFLFLFFFIFLERDPQTVFMGYSIGDYRQAISLLKPNVYLPLIFFAASLAIFASVAALRRHLANARGALFLVVAVAVFFELFSFGHDFEPFIDRDVRPLFKPIERTESIDYLKNDASLYRVYPLVYQETASTDLSNNTYFNLNILYGLDSIGGNNPFLLQDYSSFTRLRPEGVSSYYQELVENNNILSAMNVKYVLVPYHDHRGQETEGIFGAEGKDRGYQKIEGLKNPHVYLNNNWLERFYFVENIVDAEGPRQAREAFFGQGFEPEKSATVEAGHGLPASFDMAERNEYRVVEYKNNSVLLEVDLENDGFLVFSDTYYPGWKAYLDGSRIEIYKANGIFKGVFVPRGSYELRFRFLPNSFLIGAVISGAAFLAVIAALAVLWARSRHRTY